MKQLIFILLALVMSPLGVLAFVFAYQTHVEVETLQQLPHLDPAKPQHGKLYKWTGTLTFKPLQPLIPTPVGLELPRVIQIDTRDENNKYNKLRVKEFDITTKHGKTYKLLRKGSSRFFSTTRTYSSSTWKTLRQPVDVIATYEHGYLSDGRYQRMLVYPAAEREAVFEMLSDENRQKTKLLFILGCIFFAPSVLLLSRLVLNCMLPKPTRHANDQTH